MLIDCPHCGPRDVGEFAYGGDATIARPALDDTDRDAWCAYVYQRTNPMRAHREYWQHLGGCRCWLEVGRDVTTHEIAWVTLAGGTGEASSGLRDAAE